MNTPTTDNKTMDTIMNNEPTRAVITIGYHTYVMEASRALEVMKLLIDAERLESKWDTDAKVSIPYINAKVETSLRLMGEVEYTKAKMMGDVITKDNAPF